MADIKIIRVEITPAVPAVVEQRVELTLTIEEARFLRTILGNTGAPVLDKNKMYGIYNALSSAGITRALTDAKITGV